MSLPSLLANPSLLLTISGIVLLNITVIVLFYLSLVKRLKSAETERDLLKKAASDGPGSVEGARKQSMIIIQRAQEKAEQILTETKQFQLDAKRILETEMKDVSATQSQELQKASSELIQNYEESLNKVKNEDINMFKTITEGIQKDLTKEMQDFKTTLEKQTFSSQKMIESKLNEQYSQVNTEIEAYKKERLKTVDTHILQLLEKITLLTLSKSLSLKDHEELVLESLQEAKKSVQV
jgi:F0F1-type ATP synthase membrane subunit b/b'